jgi:hypothetical protein
MDVIVGTTGPRHAAARPGPRSGRVAARSVAVLLTAGGLTTGVLVAVATLVGRWA